MNESNFRIERSSFDAALAQSLNLQGDPNTRGTRPLKLANVALAFQPDAQSKRLLRQAKFFSERDDVHIQTFAQSEHSRNANVRTPADDTVWSRSHNANMAKKMKQPEHYDALKAASGWYLAAWRDLRGLSQQALADEMDTSKGQVSDLENGAVNKKGQPTRYNRDWLEKACAALGVAAGDLLDTNPAREEPKFAALRRAFPGLSEKDAETVSRLADDLVERSA